VGDDAEECVEHPVEVPSNVLREEAENQVAVFLKQTVFAAIAPIGDSICQVLRAIEGHSDTQFPTEQGVLCAATARSRSGSPFLVTASWIRVLGSGAEGAATTNTATRCRSNP